MSESTWTEISLETVGCIILLVVAFKLYRAKLTTESDCCGGAVHVEANNPHDELPSAIRGMLGEESSDNVLTLEDLEKMVQAKLHRTTNDFSDDLRAIRRLRRQRMEDLPAAADPLPLQKSLGPESRV